jgi:predicted ATPase
LFVAVGVWGAASFENDPASDWFLLVEEAVDPGGVIASALDRALAEADYLDLDASCEAIAAAELSASCAGNAPERLPDNVRRWVDAHPHQPHDSEIDHAIQAVERVRAESELRERWDEDVNGEENRWLREIDDLIARLGHSGAGDPAALSP